MKKIDDVAILGRHEVSNTVKLVVVAIVLITLWIGAQMLFVAKPSGPHICSDGDG